jgi:hypothetical protein
LASRKTNKICISLRHGCAHFITHVSHWKSRGDDGEDDLENTLPTTAPHVYSLESKESTNPSKSRVSDVTAVVSEPSMLGSPLVPPTPVNSPTKDEIGFGLDSPATPKGPTLGKQLWKNAVKNVKLRSTLGGSLATSSLTTVLGRAEPVRRRTISSGFEALDRKKTPFPGELPTFPRLRVSALAAKLQGLEATHDLAAHTALVRHMQFSPDGRFLATSRCVHVFSLNYSFITFCPAGTRHRWFSA